MIAYGIRFDTSNVGQDVTWNNYTGQEFLDGQVIRQSYDPYIVCTNDCLTQIGCNGVIVRHSDQMCFEMSGTPGNSQNQNLVLSSFNVSPVSVQWVTSLGIGIIFQMIMDAIKVILIVTIVWQCYGKYQARKWRNKPSSLPALELVEIEVDQLNQRKSTVIQEKIEVDQLNQRKSTVIQEKNMIQNHEEVIVDQNSKNIEASSGKKGNDKIENELANEDAQSIG